MSSALEGSFEVEEAEVQPGVVLSRHIQDFRNSRRDERQMFRYSLNALSLAWGFPEPALSYWINGTRNPRRETLLRLAALMDLSWADATELMYVYGYAFNSKEYVAKQAAVADIKAEVG